MVVIPIVWMVGWLASAVERPSVDDLPQRATQIFSQHCLGCHNSLDQQGGLSLETGDDLRDGGYLDWGDDNPLLAIVTGDEAQPPAMPKDGTPLNPAELLILREWLQAEAPWPAELRVGAARVQDFEWWSLRELTRPEIPSLRAEAVEPELETGGLRPEEWVRNPIDAFVWQGLVERGLRPSPAADRRTLIRRLYFDLTGLPPTPEEVAEFVADDRPDAYEQWVERLLGSPRYGERWARHWLDVARYADTAGYDKDKLRPQAWPYRDYVIRSFNQDKDYRQFVVEQIAGDVLYPGTPDGILGLGFLAAGPWDFIGHVEVPESKLDGKEARNLDRDEMVSATLNVFCSTTVQCARCHHHKFDPITLEQYYGLQSVFAAVDRANRPYDPDPQVAGRRAELQREIAATVAELAKLEAEWEVAGGVELATRRQLVAEWRQRLSKRIPEVWPEAYGYHSQLAESAGEPKWVELEFPRPSSVRRIVVHPCHDEFAGLGAGFGFPPQLEVAVLKAGESAWQVVSDSSAATSTRQPHEAWQVTPVEPVDHVIRVRITARELAWRRDLWMMALAEVEVWDPEGKNLAVEAQLSALDSIEAGPRWRLTNLTDGLRPIYPSGYGDLDEQSIAWRQAEADLQQWEELTRPPAQLEKQRSLREHLAVLQQRLASLPEPESVFAAATHFPAEGNFRPTEGRPRDVPILHRGNVSQPLDVAVPGTIPLRTDDMYRFAEKGETLDEGARRARLAQWIVAADNPLTWRSIVNRIWLWHLGRGIVDSPNDFGRMGSLPTHPELLDWLASEFRARPSFKHLSRLIVTSATYRQTSTPAGGEANAAVDADNSRYWRFNRRRLSAEELRDAMLMVAGRLDETPGGPGYFLFALERPEHSPHFVYHRSDPADRQTHRRSIYRFVVRSQPDPWITTMDGADCSQSVPKRDETLTALQSLALLNNPFTLFIAEEMAERLRRERSGLEPQVIRGFQWACGREPHDEERMAMVDYAAEHGLENLCRVLLNLSEFAFID